MKHSECMERFGVVFNLCGFEIIQFGCSFGVDPFRLAERPKHARIVRLKSAYDTVLDSFRVYKLFVRQMPCGVFKFVCLFTTLIRTLRRCQRVLLEFAVVEPLT